MKRQHINFFWIHFEKECTSFVTIIVYFNILHILSPMLLKVRDDQSRKVDFWPDLSLLKDFPGCGRRGTYSRGQFTDSIISTRLTW